MIGALEALAEASGLVWRYRDGAGREHEAPPESLQAVLAALGISAENDQAASDSLVALQQTRAARPVPEWMVVTADQPVSVPITSGATDWQLTCEDGTTQNGRAEGRIDLAPLPMGYHWLMVGGVRMAILSAPERLPPVRRGWGVMAPLYGMRPVGRGGVGDYADLAAMAETLGRHGAGFLGINPVHAGFAEDPQAFSPYSPTSRQWFATMHVAADGAEPAADGPLIDYPSALAAQKRALETAYTQTQASEDPVFQRWWTEQGDSLQVFATHQALSAVQGPYWRDWAADLQDATSDAVAEFAAANASEITFHAWLQWQAECQLAAAQTVALAAGMAHGLYLDLAVGTHPHGAETWADPDLFARGVSQGAPPDGFSPQAQVWNLAPMRPDVLSARGFAPIAHILRHQLRFSGILRIDHILGFDRAFWVPEGLPGVYVTMPKAALLAVARIEAARAGAVIIGEDLGVVPDRLREDMDQSGILGCRVAMFERDWGGDGRFLAPENYPQNAIASFGSHDLPLWRGWRAGRDIDWRQRVGDMTPEAAEDARTHRDGEVAGFDKASGDTSGSMSGMIDFLARSSARLAAVQIEDILGEGEQPNLPGTVHQHPNWRRRLRLAPAELSNNQGLKDVSAIMARHER
ncbi:MAG: 4-alpha-glucanotransferase [Paracoccaceae bacterium]|nr:4-alpha-glucanotransferase [Paracoccaceae bacterium]